MNSVYSSQHLKPLIKVVLKPKTKMCSCLRTTLMNYFDPLQMLTTVYSAQSAVLSLRTPLKKTKTKKKHSYQPLENGVCFFAGSK